MVVQSGVFRSISFEHSLTHLVMIPSQSVPKPSRVFHARSHDVRVPLRGYHSFETALTADSYRINPRT